MKWISILLLFLSLPSFSKTYEVSWQHSQLLFKVPYMKIMEVEGRFNKFKSYFELEDQNRISDLKLAIASSSIDTGNKKRDQHLRSSDFLYVSKFPEIKFSLNGPVNLSDNFKEITGELTIMGKSIPQKIQLKLIGSFQDPWDKTKSGIYLHGKTLINRKKLGLNWNKALEAGGYLVGNDVELNFKIEAFPTDNRPAFSRFFVPNDKTSKAIDSVVTEKDLESNPPEVKPLDKSFPSPEEINGSQRELADHALIMTKGFILFVIKVIAAILLQLGLVALFEKMKLGPKKSLFISSAIVMTLLLIFTRMTITWMGYTH